MNDKVLIVDDNGKNIQLLANLLTSAHYSIEYALSGKAALQWVDKEKFDLILLDIMMPGMDGFETCRLIKEMPEKKDIPIIFLTARDDTDSITKAFLTGGVDYLTKPFNQEELLVRIATHIELKHSKEKLIHTAQWLEREVDKKTIELQKANAELEKAFNDLKALDHAQNEFLKSISHEIRTPLNGIVGSLSLLKGFNDNEEIVEVVDLLERSVQKLEKYSYSALQIAYLRLKGLDKQAMQEINLNAVVKNCINRFIPVAQSKNVEICFKSNATGIKLKGDYDLINSAIVALLETSLTYSNEGSIHVTLMDQVDRIECIIEDDGVSFTDNQPLYMFDSINSKGWKYERNTSMELNLAQVIILSHEGAISFRNKEDKHGTVTTFSFHKTMEPKLMSLT